MITISLCMIVKNEEKVLGRCLDSLKGCIDEIIIVDTGSTDDTKKIAKKYTDKVYDFKWINDFSAARNFGFSKATMDYQMWLDADDVLPEKSVVDIKKLKKDLKDDVDIVTMKYVLSWDESGIPTMSSTRERLMKREKNYQWQDPVHECIPLIGNVYYSDIEIYHKPEAEEEISTRNIDIYESLEKKGIELSPRQLYYFARELKDHARWDESALYFEKFLNTEKGFVEDNIASCMNLSLCYKMLNKKDLILPSLIRSFNYDSPRVNICTEIGYYYKNLENYFLAFKWFDFATGFKKDDSIGIISLDYYGFIPNIEACVCLANLGDLKRANEYNEKAAIFKPKSAAILQNRAFFKEKLKDI